LKWSWFLRMFAWLLPKPMNPCVSAVMLMQNFTGHRQIKLLAAFPSRPQGVCSNSAHMNLLFRARVRTDEPSVTML
jgi:hypothetical protein